MINLCNNSSSKLILNSGSKLSFKEGGRKIYLAFFVSFAVDAAKICFPATLLEGLSRTTVQNELRRTVVTQVDHAAYFSKAAN
jgi:hypothetical protein